MGLWAASVGAQATDAAWPEPSGFRDELGFRREIDGPFLAAHRGEACPDDLGAAIDVRLWLAAARRAESGDVARVLGAASDGGPVAFGRDRAAGGDGSWRAIESETEAELSSIHALWILGDVDRRWRERAVSSARWCLENLQPDNATNEPWGLHVFLVLGQSDETAEATLYAQTLLQNAMVGGMQGARLPRRAAWIVRSAAEQLRRYVGGRRDVSGRGGT